MSEAREVATAVFVRERHARRAIERLLDAGFHREDLTVIARRGPGAPPRSRTGEGAAIGAASGLALGALALGTLALGAVSIPEVGLVASGAPVAALVGAGLGSAIGLAIGALIGLGMTEAMGGHARAIGCTRVVVAIEARPIELGRAVALLRAEGGATISAPRAARAALRPRAPRARAAARRLALRSSRIAPR